MKFKVIACLASLCIGSGAFAQDNFDLKEVESLVAKSANQPVELNEGFKITLANKENAYLFTAYFPEAGRRYSYGAVIYRPSKKKVKILSDLSGTRVDLAPETIGHGLPTYVSATVGFYGQGNYEGKKLIMYFNKWNEKIVHTRDEKNTSEYCRPCTDIEYSWNFKDIDNDGFKDLVETKVTTSRSKSAVDLMEGEVQKEEVTSITSELIFKNNQFVPKK